MIDIIKTALIDFSIYGLFVLIYTLVGAYQNINIWDMKWDWKLWLNGLVKYLTLGSIVLGSAVGSYLLLAQASAQGIEITNANAIAPKAIMVLVMLGSGAILVKIIAKLATRLGISEDTLKAIQTQAVNQDAGKPMILNLADVPMPSEDYIAAKIKNEEEGGVGAFYNVTTDSYAAFKATVLGNGYDIDGYYGFQCWDGDALLWQQFGKQLVTGNGLAIGCWDLNRDRNKYDLFTLIDNVNALELGDAVVMRPNHIGFFDGYDGDYMLILGQNQGGTPKNAAGGSGFNIVRVHKSAFAGAFRLNKWHVAPAPTPVPTPTPEPTPSPINSEFSVNDVATITSPFDINGNKLDDWVVGYVGEKGHTPFQIYQMRADGGIVIGRDGIVVAAMTQDKIKKI